MQDGLAIGVLQVQGQAAFVSGGELPVIVYGFAGNGGGGAPGIAGAGGFDLNHVGAEVGQDGRGGGAGDPACAVDDFQSG